MITYTHKETGQRFKFLAHGIFLKDGIFDPVIVYCPDDNENTILVMQEKEFYETFEMGIEEIP